MSGILSRLAQTVTPAARAQTSVSPALAGLGSFKAYHASPHDFDRFDFAPNMGKGEGFQAYGDGGYFAGNENVVDDYHKMFIRRAKERLIKPEELREYFTPGRIVNSYGGRDKVLGFRENDGWNWVAEVLEVDANGMPVPGARPRTHSTMPLGSAVDAVLRPGAKPSHRYEVEIGVDPKELIDLDASAVDSPQIDSILKAIERAPLGPHKRLAQEMAGSHGKSVQDVIRFVGSAGEAVGEPNVPAAFSRSLLDDGIPGSRYLDAGSRRAGEGTHNYVMFPGTEDMIKILRKYSILAPLAGAAASQSD